MLIAIPPAMAANNIPKFIKVVLSDIIVPRNFGSCSITKLPPAVNDIPENQKRRALKPHESEKVGTKVNDKVSKAAAKQVTVPKGFRPTRLTKNPATTPPTAAKMFPTTMIKNLMLHLSQIET